MPSWPSLPTAVLFIQSVANLRKDAKMTNFMQCQNELEVATLDAKAVTRIQMHKGPTWMVAETILGAEGAYTSNVTPGASKT